MKIKQILLFQVCHVHHQKKSFKMRFQYFDYIQNIYRKTNENHVLKYSIMKTWSLILSKIINEQKSLGGRIFAKITL